MQNMRLNVNFNLQIYKHACIISMDLKVPSVAFHRELQINLLHPKCIQNAVDDDQQQQQQRHLQQKTALNLIMDLFLGFGTVSKIRISLKNH